MDIQLHYTELGSGEPLILLHGNGEDSTYFEHQVEFFATRFRVFVEGTHFVAAENPDVFNRVVEEFYCSDCDRNQ